MLICIENHFLINKPTTVHLDFVPYSVLIVNFFFHSCAQSVLELNPSYSVYLFSATFVDNTSFSMNLFVRCTCINLTNVFAHYSVHILMISKLFLGCFSYNYTFYFLHRWTVVCTFFPVTHDQVGNVTICGSVLA